MIKVAFLVRSLEYGGAERQVVTLANALDKTCFDVTILCFYSGGELENQLDDGVRLIYLKKQGRWDILAFLWQLYRALKNIQPAILHGYLSTQNLLTILFKPFLLDTRMFWGIRATKVDFSRYSRLAALLFRLECFFSRFADLIIVNSEAGYKYHLMQGFPKAKMVVINNGIDTNLFKIDSEARIKIRAEWQILPQTILIGLVGRLDPIKDHSTFLQSAALLAKNRHDVRFVCVGSGTENQMQTLSQLAKQLGIEDKVLWAGKRVNMSEVYNALDLLSSSSQSEGFANAIAEAMACGVSCVVTDVGDSALIVGDIGVVLPPQNPEALVAGWIACLAKDRDAIRLQARSRIVDNFSVQQLVKQTQSVIKSQLN